MQLSIPVAMIATEDGRNKRSLNVVPTTNNKLHQDLAAQIAKRCFAKGSTTVKIWIDKNSLVFKLQRSALK
jgi:hypothetical protein